MVIAQYWKPGAASVPARDWNLEFVLRYNSYTTDNRSLEVKNLPSHSTMPLTADSKVLESRYEHLKHMRISSFIIIQAQVQTMSNV